jgi:nicotinate-nucleotide adenylyltransferase
MALEVAELFGEVKVGLMPSPGQAIKTHNASFEDRVAMLELAVSQSTNTSAGLYVDETERRTDGNQDPVFTVDTLTARREQLGPDVPIIFVLGLDAFLQIRSWHRWDSILRYGHLLVVDRPVSEGGDSSALVMRLMADMPGSGQAVVEDPRALQGQPAGLVHLAKLSRLAIASSDLRRRLADGRSISYFTPEPVVRRIEETGLYSMLP